MSSILLPQVLTEPRSCLTCRHGVTKRMCDGCLVTKDDLWLTKKTGKNTPFRYAHWEKGDWREDALEAYRTGERDIPLRGEADVDATDSLGVTLKRLLRVGCECGFLAKQTAENEITVYHQEGTFLLVYGPVGKITNTLAEIRVPAGDGSWKTWWTPSATGDQVFGPI
jgi:hypothetical protein